MCKTTKRERERKPQENSNWMLSWEFHKRCIKIHKWKMWCFVCCRTIRNSISTFLISFMQFSIFLSLNLSMDKKFCLLYLERTNFHTQNFLKSTLMCVCAYFLNENFISLNNFFWCCVLMETPFILHLFTSLWGVWITLQFFSE